MGILKAFFMVPSRREFVRDFSENLQPQADTLWRNLDNVSPWLLAATAVIAVGLTCYYYYPFNEQPGRHYLPKYWVIFFITAIIATLVVPLGMEYLLIKTHLNDAFWLLLRAAINCAFYGAVIYFLVSVILCNTGRNNAYKIFKL
jgi:hypothetical protein